VCKFIAIVNKRKGNTETINKVLQANINQLSVEPDGFSVFRQNKTAFGTEFYPKPEHYDNLEQVLEYRGEQVFIVHFRNKTCGAVGIDGLHLQPMVGGFYCCHNGTVSHFSQVTDKNDSLYFFNAILHESKKKGLTKELIEGAGNDLGFDGKAVMYQPSTKTMHLFCNREMELNILPDCLIFSSFPLTKKIAQYETYNALGWEWYKQVGEEKIEFLHHEKIDDHYIKISNFNVVDFSRIKIEISYAGYYSRNDYPKEGKQKWNRPNLLETKEDKDKEGIVTSKTIEMPILE
jgi:hypothetical protein